MQPGLEAHLRPACRRALLLISAALLGCAGGSYYQSHAERHPDWSPTPLPTLGVDLESLVASLDAPGSGISNLRVTETLVTGEERLMTPRQMADRGHEPDPASTYIVMGEASCAARTSGLMHRGSAVVWYYLEANRVTGFRHVEFAHDCTAFQQSHRPESWTEAMKKVPGFETPLGTD